MSSDEPRCDKVTLLRDMEHDRFQTWYAAFRSQCEAIAEEAGVPLNISVRTRARDMAANTWKYEVDTWGEFSDALLRQLPDAYLDWVSRLDWRQPLDVEPATLPRLDLFVRNHGRGKRNTQLFNTRPRIKKEGRNAGGQGWAMGSHKSDKRVVVYSKGGERGAVELNVSGASLSNLISTAGQLVSRKAYPTMYAALMDTMAISADGMARQMGFEDMQQLMAYVADDTPAAALSTGLTPEAVAQIKVDIASMPAAQRKALARALGFKPSDMR